MLIRSQDKESLIAIDGNFVEILKYGDLSECSITVSTRDHSSLHVMARYSSVEKALKVLDMIQEAYEEYKITCTFLTGFTGHRSIAESNNIQVNGFEELVKSFKKNMVFQMPADSEVEV
jgi:hypothetical protein